MTTARDKIAQIIQETVFGPWFSEVSGEYDAADLILAAISDMIAPLVWVVDEDRAGTHTAFLRGHNYCIDWHFHGWSLNCNINDILMPIDLGAEHPTLESAKAAANAHRCNDFKKLLKLPETGEKT